MNKKTKKQLSTTTTQNTNVSITTTTVSNHERVAWKHTFGDTPLIDTWRSKKRRCGHDLD